MLPPAGPAAGGVAGIAGTAHRYPVRLPRLCLVCGR